MKESFLIVGAGRIGYAVAWNLSKRGYKVIVSDICSDRLEYASRKLNVETVKANALKRDSLEQLRNKATIACTALPGWLSSKAALNLISLGFNVIDAGIEDIKDLDRIGKEASSHNVFIVPYAGLAPGLSHVLAGRLYFELQIPEIINIYVGGLPLKVKNKPLKTNLTWSSIDFLKRYLRPAMVVIDGNIEYKDPLTYSGKVVIPMVGEYEYFVSDGLRSLPYTLSKVKNMAEYTLRYKGHLNFMRTLKSIGLLSEEPVEVEGVKVKPIELLAKLLEQNLTVDVRDKVVLYVEGGKDCYRKGYLVVDRYDERYKMTAMSRTTGFTQAAIAILGLEGKLPKDKGIVYPEEIGIVEECFENLWILLREEGIKYREIEYDTLRL